MITIKSFEVNYFSENTYLLYDDTKEAVLIDRGCLRKDCLLYTSPSPRD